MSYSISRRALLKRLGLVAAAGFTIRALPSLAFANESQPTPSEVELNSISELVRLFMGKYQVPGLSMAIARHDQFVYRKAFGFADQGTDQRVTPSSLFRIASVSKPITSVAIFTLIERNQLKLDDLVFGQQGILGFDYGSAYSERVQQIRVVHLLTHTSGGWSNEADDPMFFDPKMSQSDLIKWTLREVPLQHEPGQHYVYSNFGYCILGRVVEKLGGQAYEQFAQQNVLAKCGVEDMRIGGNTPAERSMDEVAYYGQKGAQPFWTDPYGFNVRRMDSHGGWIATPSDLVSFAMHVDGFSYTPSILEASSIQTMTEPCTVSPMPHYAKGWFVNDRANWWHSGVLPGTSSILVRTSSGLCWAALANTFTSGIPGGLDHLMWDVVKSVPAWRALDSSGFGNWTGLTPLRSSSMY